MNKKLNMNQQHVLVVNMALSITKNIAAKDDPSPLLSSNEAASSFLDSVPGFPVQKRHEHIGLSPAKDNKDDKGFGASLIQGKADEAGTLQPQKEEAQGDIILAYR